MTASNNLIIAAARFAHTAHSGQTRRFSGTQYIAHPARVAGRVAVYPQATEELVASAFLHDVVEDTGCTIENIRNAFGPTVAMFVAELTKIAERGETPRACRVQAEFSRLRKVSWQAKIIKLLDRIDNLLDLDRAPVEFVRQYVAESRDLVDAIGNCDVELRDELLHSIEEHEAEIGEPGTKLSRN